MSESLQEQAQRLYSVFAELVRAYQFRDREGICSHGLSVSQCYALDTLDTRGAMTMGELADHLRLETSTMTRVMDGLVAGKLAVRAADPRDRRVCRVQTSRKGRSLVSRIRNELILEHKLVLKEIPSESREAVIKAVSLLLSAFNERQRCLSADAEGTKRGKRKVG